MKRFEDRVVLVTGGSSGIGRAAALHLASAGARVIITGRRSDAIAAAAADHINIVSTVANAASPQDAMRTIREAIERWGQLDILINNARAGAIMPLGESTEEKISDIFAVNVLGPSPLAKEALPYLEKAKGSIVNVSSTYGSKHNHSDLLIIDMPKHSWITSRTRNQIADAVPCALLGIR